MHHPHGLHHMRMATDDKVGSLVDEELGQLALPGILIKHIFYAPMHGDAQYLGTGLPGEGYFPSDTVAVDHSHLHAIARWYAVGAVGVVKESESYAINILYEWHKRIALRRVMIGADMVYAQGIESLQSAACRLVARVEAMIIGGQEEVEPCITQRLGIAVGGREAGVAAIYRATSERHFEIAHRIISFSDDGGDERETS